MTFLDIMRHFRSRRELLAEMLTQIHRLKECDQCRSVVMKERGVCPYCGTYRFIEDEERVAETIQVMGQMPWPRAVGVVPRLPASKRDLKQGSMYGNRVAARECNPKTGGAFHRHPRRE